MRKALFTLLLPFALLGVSACAREPEPGILVAAQATAASEEETPASETPQGDVEAGSDLEGIKNFIISDGAAVATSETATSLNLATVPTPLGASVAFRAGRPIPQDTLDRTDFRITMTGDPNNPNLVVLYRLLPVDGLPPVVGLIPLSYLKVDATKKNVLFKCRGLGDYQVATTASIIVKPLASNGTKAPNPEPRLELLGKINYANYYGIDVAGTNAYLIGDTGLRIVNFVDPKLPVQVGIVSNAGGGFGAGRGISLRGTQLFQTTFQGGYGTFDVTAPTLSRFLGGVGDQEGRDIVMIGQTYGFGATVQGVRMFSGTGDDILNETIAAQTGGCHAVDGNLTLMVAACNNLVIGFTTDALPTVNAISVDPELGGRGVELDNNYAYVAGDDGLRIYDVINPLAPVKRGTMPLPGALQVAVRGNLAIVITATSASIIDVTNKTNPVPYSSTLPFTNARRVKFAAPDRALILDGTGLSIIGLN